jgi:response regulator RpfG family c-di-GMP phosphodiesterase
MSDIKVLLVDDDPNVLQGYQRNLRKRFDIETALCSEEALTAIHFLGPFAVIVSDMNMPRQNGIQLMQKLIQQSPDSVRIMLTGNADQQTATDAINVGKVFRFLNKPCQVELLGDAIQAAIEHYRRVVAEREILRETVQGSIRMLTEVLSVVNPVAFGRASRVHQLVKELLKHVDVDQPWECEMAAMLSQVGCVSVPADTLYKSHHGKPLTQQEVHLLAGRYQLAFELISQVPRLENVARIVELQDDRYLVEEPSRPVPLSAHLLRVAREFDSLMQEDHDEQLALARLEYEAGDYSPEALAALRSVVAERPGSTIHMVSITALQDGWNLAADITTQEGFLLVKKGQLVTSALRARLVYHLQNGTITEPVAVEVPSDISVPPSPEKELALSAS